MLKKKEPRGRGAKKKKKKEKGTKISHIEKSSVTEEDRERERKE